MTPLDQIYVIRRISDGAIKIGRTGALHMRVAAIRAQHGPCEIVHTEPVEAVISAAAEALAHAEWSRYNIGGDWFKLPGNRTGVVRIRQAVHSIRKGWRAAA